MKQFSKKGLIFTILIAVSIITTAFIPVQHQSMQLQGGDAWEVYTDFSTYDNMFSTFEDDQGRGNALYLNGGIELSLYGEDLFNRSPLLENPPQDFIATVELQLTSQDINLGAGLICNYDYRTDEGIYFEMLFDQSYVIYAINDGEYYHLDGLDTNNPQWNSEGDFEYYSTSSINPMGSNYLTVKCGSGSYELTINDSNVANFTAPFNFSPTDISLFTYSYTDNDSVVLFDNFYATSTYSSQSTQTGSKPVSNPQSSSSDDFLYTDEDGVTYYYDPFEGTTLFGEYQDDSSSILQRNNSLVMDINTQGYSVWTSPDATIPEKLGVDVEVTLLNPNAIETVAGVACDFVSNSEMPTRPHAYGVFFEITFDGYYAIYQNTQAGVMYYTNGAWEYYGGAVSDIPDLYQPFDNINTTTLNYLTIKCIDNNYGFKINGETVALSDTFTRIPNSNVILYTGSYYEPQTSVKFDNFYLIDAWNLE